MDASVNFVGKIPTLPSRRQRRPAYVVLACVRRTTLVERYSYGIYKLNAFARYVLPWPRVFRQMRLHDVAARRPALTVIDRPALSSDRSEPQVLVKEVASYRDWERDDRLLTLPTIDSSLGQLAYKGARTENPAPDLRASNVSSPSDMLGHRRMASLCELFPRATHSLTHTQASKTRQEQEGVPLEAFVV